ncbi:hypothetical protein [Streptomyces sp. KL116D]|uniref:hypothetical protein n=1 Tax=Streptomyces sp. KL116D TaxID=3045152 RepID=UPI003558F498
MSPIDGSAIGAISRTLRPRPPRPSPPPQGRLPRRRHPRADRARILHAIADGVEKRLEELSPSS